MSSEIQTPNRVVLTGPENFSHWKLRIPGILRQEKVLGVATGTVPMPEMPEMPDEKATFLLNAWREKDQKAQCVIMNTISDQVGFRLEEENLAPLAKGTTSKKMFDKLLEMHEDTNSDILAIRLGLELFELRWDGESRLEDHTSRISAMRSRLALLKRPVDDFTMVILLIRSLPNTAIWEPIKASAIQAFPKDKKVSYQEIENQILRGAALTDTLKRESEQPASALKVSKPKRTPTAKEGKECELHGSGGHSTEECWTLKKKWEEGKECELHGSGGHSTEECWTLKKKWEEGKECELHGSGGHSTEECWTLKKKWECDMQAKANLAESSECRRPKRPRRI